MIYQMHFRCVDTGFEQIIRYDEHSIPLVPRVGDKIHVESPEYSGVRIVRALTYEYYDKGIGVSITLEGTNR